MTGRMDSKHSRVAVITGGAAGIGRAYALRLASEGAGIVIADRVAADELVAEIERLGGRALSSVCDVTSEDSVQNCSKQVLETFGRVDILINNAGIYPFQAFDAISFADWRRVMSVNLDGRFLMCKAFVPSMRKAAYGRIVNVSSGECWMAASDNLHYTASKMGVVGLIRALATEVAADGIVVNAIAPGITGGTSINTMMPKYLAMIPQLQAIKRAGTPADLAAVVSFRTSHDAGFMTGQTIFKDAGAVRL